MALACIEKYAASSRVMEACLPWTHSADITNVPNGGKPEASGFLHETTLQSKMCARVYDKRWCIKPLGVVNVEYLCSHLSCYNYVSTATLRLLIHLQSYTSHTKRLHLSEGTMAVYVNITSTPVYSKNLKVSRTSRRCTHVTE